MKKIPLILLLIIASLLLSSCRDDGNEKDDGDNTPNYGDENMNNEGQYTMIATVMGVSDVIEVEVISAPYDNTGVFWVLTSPETTYRTSDGRVISRSDIKVGDRVSVTYGGQVMMSLPPRISAYTVTVE